MNNGARPGLSWKVTGAGLLLSALLGAALLNPADAAAAQADVRLGTVNCGSTPEVIEVKNFGTEDQSLSGWRLVSDPNESFDLTAVGTLPAGGSVFIEAGPGAQAAFTWSQSQVLRDNDPGDYVRLVDNTGATRSEIACAQATPTPLPATPTPTPGPGAIPNGGGPPIATGPALSPVTLAYAGVGLATASAGVVLAWLGVNFGFRRRRQAEPAAARADVKAEPDSQLAEEAAPQTRPAPLRRHSRGAPVQPLILALFVALAAAVLVALLVQSQETSRRR